MVSITFEFPVRFKRITNGEKVIERTGPDEIEVDICEGKIQGESWLQELNRFLNEAERELRKSRRRKSQEVADFNSRRSLTTWDQKTTEANKATERTEVASTKGGGGTKTTALIARN